MTNRKMKLFNLLYLPIDLWVHLWKYIAVIHQESIIVHFIFAASPYYSDIRNRLVLVY